MNNYFLIGLTIICYGCTNAQIPSKVDFDAYQKLTIEVNGFRKNRLVDFKTFLEYSNQEKTIILDARSKEMFDRKHIKGAINLNFSDFTQTNLEKIIPGENYRILIYCNNNIEGDQTNFAEKLYQPEPIVRYGKGLTKTFPATSLALNVPTFITLYGYGYRNIYELSELISVYDSRIEFEGTDVPQKLNIKLSIRDCNHGHICCNVGCSCCTETQKIIK